MIILHVTYTAKEGQGKGFVEEMAASGIQRRVKAEQGNIMYDYFYSAESPDKVLLLEKWESGEALEAHLNGDCIRDIKPIKAKYIAESAIERFEVQERRVNIDINTKFVTLIGEPPDQSFSASMQNSDYVAAGINMLYFYTEAGCGVTKPNKVEMIEIPCLHKPYTLCKSDTNKFINKDTRDSLPAEQQQSPDRAVSDALTEMPPVFRIMDSPNKEVLLRAA